MAGKYYINEGKNRNTEVQITEEEICKLPKKEFRIMIVKTIKNLENKMEKMQESINKDLEELMEKAMAPHSSTLAWKIPWMEEPGGPLSMGSHRIGHNWSDLAVGKTISQIWLNYAGTEPWDSLEKPQQRGVYTDWWRYLSGGKKPLKFNFTEDEPSHSVFFLRRGIFFSEDGLYRVNPQKNSP